LRRKPTGPQSFWRAGQQCIIKHLRTQPPSRPQAKQEMRMHLGVWGQRPQRESRGQRPLVPAAQARVQGSALPQSAQDASPARGN